MKKCIFLFISIMLLSACTTYKPQVLEALQVGGDYISENDKYQLVFLDASSFAILDSNEDAITKGTYEIRSIGSKYYRITVGPKILFTVAYSRLLKRVVFPETIAIDGITFYVNDLMN